MENAMDANQHSAKDTLLIVDDDPGIIEVLTAYGEPWGWSVTTASSFNEALVCLAHHMPHVIVLDWQLPDSDGLTSIRALRAHTTVPILMLTVRDQEPDIIRALQLGADDYVVKPFSPGQVLARCGALRRRGQDRREGSPDRVEVKDLVIDISRRQVWRRGVLMELTTLEFELLRHLVTNPGRVWTREELLDRIWGDVGEVFDRAVDMEIARLRKKLGDLVETPRYIDTIRGVGYRWRDDPGPDGP